MLADNTVLKDYNFQDLEIPALADISSMYADLSSNQLFITSRFKSSMISKLENPSELVHDLQLIERELLKSVFFYQNAQYLVFKNYRGGIHLISLQNPLEKKCFQLENITCLYPNKDKIICGTKDGKIYQTSLFENFDEGTFVSNKKVENLTINALGEILTLSEDNVMCLFSANLQLLSKKQLNKKVRKIQFLSHPHMLLAVNDNFEIDIWRLDDMKVVHTIRDHKFHILEIIVCCDEINLMFTGCLDGKIRVYNLFNFQLEETIEMTKCGKFMMVQSNMTELLILTEDQGVKKMNFTINQEEKIIPLRNSTMVQNISDVPFKEKPQTPIQECLACCERKRNIYFTACHHILYCKQCYDILPEKTCGACRAKSEGVIVYFT